MSYQLNLTFGYKDTDFSRVYAFEVDDSVSSADIVNAIKSVNSSLKGGTDGGLTNFFLSDDYDSDEGIGTFKGIQNATIISKTVENINLEEDE